MSLGPDDHAIHTLAIEVAHQHAGDAMNNAGMSGTILFGSISTAWQMLRAGLPPWSVVPALLTSVAALLMALANFRRAFWPPVVILPASGNTVATTSATTPTPNPGPKP